MDVFLKVRVALSIFWCLCFVRIHGCGTALHFARTEYQVLFEISKSKRKPTEATVVLKDAQINGAHLDTSIFVVLVSIERLVMTRGKALQY